MSAMVVLFWILWLTNYLDLLEEIHDSCVNVILQTIIPFSYKGVDSQN